MSAIFRITREDGQFSIAPDKYVNEYYQASLNGEVYVYFHVQYVSGTNFVQLHLNLVTFSLSICKELKRDFEDFKWVLRFDGFKRIVGFKDDTDIEQWRKVVRLAGFDEPSTTILGGKEFKYIEMEL